MKLYNTLSRKKEELPEPEEQRKLRLFVCGPTVYDYTHIGHARTYLFFDFFAKYLRHRGYEVNYLQNITDIDDKIIARAADRKIRPDELAQQFTDFYFEDMKTISVDAVTIYAPATAFISQIVAQVERLVDKGFAYKIENDGWYFDISKDEDYGKLSGRTASQAEDGVSRIDDSDAKRNRGDFCLWKFSKPNEPKWNTRIGTGRPGWHIEDTAISEYYFGPQYDIHGGADDLKFPHHEAEIAQQESASGLKPFVRFWVHTGFLLVDGKKMSKSLGNFVTIRDFLKKYPPEVLRWITLAHHYRSPVDFSDELAEQAKAALENLYNHYLALRDEDRKEENRKDHGTLTAWQEKFNAALNDDLNTPQALAVMFDLLKDKDLSIKEKRVLFDSFDQTLGLDIARKAEEIPPHIAERLAQYNECRANKQFVQSDALRKEIEALGYEVRDTEKGSGLVKKFF
ncbi:MAG: cysteine--tRNA ligase [Minisyncoccia bacterium]